MKKAREIKFSPPDISELEVQEVVDALRSGWITTGPRTKQLERNLADYLHVNRFVCLSSATAAEEIVLRMLGIGPGDEVIVPAYTYTASASAAIHVGAKVIFIDSQKDSLEMDYDAMEAAINERTKAIVPVDLGGIVCDYDRIYQAVENKKHLFRVTGEFEFGRKIQSIFNRVFVVSDCAHALGAKRDGKMAGQLADFSTFSFHAVKNFTTAEGGGACWKKIDGIDDEEIYKWFQLFSLHGQSKDALSKTQVGSWEYDIVAPMYKCNMTDIAAAMGLKQLERYPGMLKRRKDIIAIYDKMCDKLGVKHLNHYTDKMTSSGHLYIVNVPWADDALRREIIIKMGELGIACNVHYKPLPMMTAYKAYGWDIKDFPNAYAHFENAITLPLHTCLSDEDVEYIVECFTEVINATK